MRGLGYFGTQLAAAHAHDAEARRARPFPPQTGLDMRACLPKGRKNKRKGKCRTHSTLCSAITFWAHFGMVMVMTTLCGLSCTRQK